MTWTNLTEEQLKAVGRWLDWAEHHAMWCYKTHVGTGWSVWRAELDTLAGVQVEIRAELEKRRKVPVGTVSMNIGH